MKYLVILFLVVVLVGCKESTSNPTPTPAVETKANMQPDSTLGVMYYSLDGDSIVPASKAGTAEWDVKLPYLLCCGQSRQIDIMLNSGTVGIGTTKGALVSQRFETITTVPVVTLKADDTASANRVIPVAVVGSEVMFVYDIPSHTLRPSPDRTLIIQTNKGKMVKLQFTSIYKDNVASPMLTTPIGYYHFRYSKAVDGKF